MNISVAVLFITAQNKKQPTKKKKSITETGTQKYTPKCSCLYIKGGEGVGIEEIAHFTQYFSVHFNFYTENEFLHCVILLNPGIRTPFLKKKKKLLHLFIFGCTGSHCFVGFP